MDHQHNSYIEGSTYDEFKSRLPFAFKSSNSATLQEPPSQGLSPVRTINSHFYEHQKDGARLFNQPRANSPNALLPMAQRAPLIGPSDRLTPNTQDSRPTKKMLTHSQIVAAAQKQKTTRKISQQGNYSMLQPRPGKSDTGFTIGGGSHSVIAEYLEKRLVGPTRTVQGLPHRGIRSKSTQRNEAQLDVISHKNAYFGTKRGSEHGYQDPGRYFDSRRDTIEGQNESVPQEHSERASNEQKDSKDSKHPRPLYGGVTPEDKRQGEAQRKRESLFALHTLNNKSSSVSKRKSKMVAMKKPHNSWLKNNMEVDRQFIKYINGEIGASNRDPNYNQTLPIESVRENLKNKSIEEEDSKVIPKRETLRGRSKLKVDDPYLDIPSLKGALASSNGSQNDLSSKASQLSSLYRTKQKVPNHTIYIKNQEGESISSSNSAYQNYTRALSTRPNAKKVRYTPNAVSPIRRQSNTSRKKRTSPKVTNNTLYAYAENWPHKGSTVLPHQPRIPNPYIVKQREETVTQQFLRGQTQSLQNQEEMPSFDEGSGSSPDMTTMTNKGEKLITQQIIKAAKDQFKQEKRNSFGNRAVQRYTEQPPLNLPHLDQQPKEKQIKSESSSSQRVYDFSQKVFMRGQSFLEPIESKNSRNNKKKDASRNILANKKIDSVKPGATHEAIIRKSPLPGNLTPNNDSSFPEESNRFIKHLMKSPPEPGNKKKLSHNSRISNGRVSRRVIHPEQAKPTTSSSKRKMSYLAIYNESNSSQRTIEGRRQSDSAKRAPPDRQKTSAQDSLEKNSFSRKDFTRSVSINSRYNNSERNKQHAWQFQQAPSQNLVEDFTAVLEDQRAQFFKPADLSRATSSLDKSESGQVLDNSIIRKKALEVITEKEGTVYGENKGPLSPSQLTSGRPQILIENGTSSDESKEEVQDPKVANFDSDHKENLILETIDDSPNQKIQKAEPFARVKQAKNIEDDVVENETKYEVDQEKSGQQQIPFDDLVKDRLSSYFNEDLRNSLFETTELKRRKQIARGKIMFASEANRTTMSTAVPQKASQQKQFESQKYKHSKTDQKGGVLKVTTSLDSDGDSPEKKGEETTLDQKNLLLSILSKDEIFQIQKNIYTNLGQQEAGARKS